MIREARPEDLAGVARLRWQWIAEKGEAPQGNPEEFTAALTAWAREHRDSHRCFVALLEDEVVGMAWLALVPRVPTPSAPQRFSGDVQSVYVAPELRDAGLGGRLIDEILTVARKAGYERVTVHSSPGAVPMYERHGFKTSVRLLQVATT